MKKIKQNTTMPSFYNIFFAIVMLITWFISFYLIYEMKIENALILSMLTAIISLTITKFKYLIDKKKKIEIFKNIILLIVPSFGFILGIASILYFWVGFTGEITFTITLSSYALLLMLIPVKTSALLQA